MAFKPVSIYRMAKCRKCPYHCRPCLTLEEGRAAELAVLEAAERGEAWKTNKVCEACHQKSNDSQNRWTFKQVGRDFNEYGLTESELLEREIIRLQAELKKVLSKKDK